MYSNSVHVTNEIKIKLKKLNMMQMNRSSLTDKSILILDLFVTMNVKTKTVFHK